MLWQPAVEFSLLRVGKVCILLRARRNLVAVFCRDHALDERKLTVQSTVIAPSSCQRHSIRLDRRPIAIIQLSSQF